MKKEEANDQDIRICSRRSGAAICSHHYARWPLPLRGPEARRNPHLHDPGRRAAELRRSPRDHLRDHALGGAVLQRADPGQSGQSVLDHRLRLRSVHRDADADRWRQDLHLQDPRGRQIPRRLAADRRGRGGELAGDHPSRRGRVERAREPLTSWSTRSRRPTRRPWCSV